MANKNDDEVSRLLRQNVDALYAHLAKITYQEKGLLFSEQEAVEQGKGIFSKASARIHELICIQWDFCKKRDDPGLQDAITLVTTVADVIAAASIGVPPFVIASILFKIGLGNFCKCPVSK